MRMPADQVQNWLTYDEATGKLYRKVEKRCGKNNAVVRYRVGDEAGSLALNGYVQVALEGHIYYAHRLAFAIKTGRWPEPAVDHINHDRSDNRWGNLREVTMSANGCNRRGPSKRNALGVAGVHRSFGKFQARISHKGVRVDLGRFDTVEKAAAAYQEAKQKRDAQAFV